MINRQSVIVATVAAAARGGAGHHSCAVADAVVEAFLPVVGKPREGFWGDHLRDAIVAAESIGSAMEGMNSEVKNVVVFVPYRDLRRLQTEAYEAGDMAGGAVARIAQWHDGGLVSDAARGLCAKWIRAHEEEEAARAAFWAAEDARR